MRNIALYAGGLLFLGLSLLTSFKYKQIKNLRYLISMEELYSSTASYNRFSEIKCNNTPISTNLNIFSLHNNKEDINTLYDSGPKVVLRVSELTCSECYEKELENLKKLADSIGESNIIIFTKSANVDYLLRFKRVNQLIYQVYNIPNDTITPLDKLNIPYYFVLDSNKIVSKIFIPDRSYPENSFRYFEIIGKQYFER